MKVDKEQEFCGMKVGMSRGRQKVTKSDHFPIIVLLENMPKANMKVQKEASWNLYKEAGWETYKSVMEEVAKELELVVDDTDLSEEEGVQKFDAAATKAKFKAFGKSKPMTRRAENVRLETKLKAVQGLEAEEKVKALLRRQYNSMEEEINKLKEGKFGRVTNIFKMKDIVAGGKKTPQEAHAVLDPETKEIVVDNESIKKATLSHCMNTFRHDQPHEDVKMLVDMVNSVHDKRMLEKDVDEQPLEITRDDFDDLVKKLKTKNKRSYDFLVRTGDHFKLVVFKLCKRLLEAEEFPARFYETTLHQLWKKKFPKKDLGNHRFLHIKDWLPKCCKALVVSKMK